jgi:hypothetical protein
MSDTSYFVHDLEAGIIFTFRGVSGSAVNTVNQFIGSLADDNFASFSIFLQQLGKLKGRPIAVILSG